ncbi:hypothetical protein BGZ70_010563 [Mortierella alpina]|uniref:Uncharacterized protein n=1 Tax=Mortierella alpina TaxID=64518 RepID=A0A9P6JCD4_MORAP|nr:hypothetical protein BGZ70_010563 [Mortierella alpina]
MDTASTMHDDSPATQDPQAPASDPVQRPQTAVQPEEIIGSPANVALTRKTSTLSTPATPTTPTTPSFTSVDSNATSSDTNRFGAKKIRVNPGSNISRRITMLAAGKNENGSDLHTTDHASAPDIGSSSGQTTPDPSEYPDSLFEELLRQDQTTLSRSFTTMPKPASRPTSTLTSKHSLPSKLPSTNGGSSRYSTSTMASKDGDATVAEPAFVPSGDLEEDLKRLQAELAKTKDTKAKAEADAKAQRVTVMSLKTEVQLVRNVLKRRETELGDVKDMSGAYEGELSELRRKLENSERELSKGQGEMAAKVRALERLRDESITRIQTLDQEIKKLREQLQEAEKKNAEAQSEILGLREELEELTPFRTAAGEQREFSAQEPTKMKELSLQITDLEDTRDMQAALIEELETKITTVEAEALEFKGKAELEYEALSDGFKVLKTRRSEEIKVLKAELEQHKLQEQIIEKLQADIDQLQSALALVASSQSTENARINQVTAELNEALALKDQEVVQVRQSMTEFEESHNRLVGSLQATLATINEEADSARKSRDEAVTALESLREELEALRHSLPINNKHMSLSQWSAEQQQLQQEQLQAIRELEEKLDGQVEGVKEDQQRADLLGENTKRKSQQLTLDMEHHLQLSSAMVQQSASDQQEKDKAAKVDDSSDKLTVPSTSGKDSTFSKDESGTISVRTMLKFLSQLQGRSSDLPEKATHFRDGTEATIVSADSEHDYENQLRVYLTSLNDASLVEPWAKEKGLENEIGQLEQKIQSLLSDLSVSDQKRTEAEVQLQAIESKEQELTLKETLLREKELALQNKEKVLAMEHEERQKRADAFPMTPPFSAPITPFGSPSNADLLPSLMAAHLSASADKDQANDDDDGAVVALVGGDDKRQQAEISAQQIKLIKSLEEKIAELEKRGSLPALDEHQIQSSFPSPPTSVVGARNSQSSSIAGSTLTRISSQTLRSSLLSNPPDTPPPTIALPPIPTSPEYEASHNGSRSSLSVGGDEAGSSSSARKKSGLGFAVSSDLSSKAATAAATEAAVAAAVAKSLESQRELGEKLEQSLTELTNTRSMYKELESELTMLQTKKLGQSSLELEVQKLKQENAELTQVLEEIRRSLDQSQTQARGLEALKMQLEAQVQKERQLKDEAQDHLQQKLEEEKQKKKGLYAKGRVLGFKRAKRNQRPDISLVQIEGVKTAADTEFYLGKRIAFVYRAKREVNGSKIRCIWGRITRSHGGSGAVKARFRNNLPAKSFGASVRVMMYPSR